MREAFRGGLRSRGTSLALLTLICASAFIGRSVNTSDGAEVVSESLGLFVQGRLGFGRIPAAGPSAPEPVPPAHSKYGLYASLLPLPTLGPAWSLRRLIGAPGVDALTALTWSFGAALAALAFGSLVRALRPEATGPWEVAFVAGTFLWPYAADSFVEPFAAAGLAAGAALALSGRPGAAAAAPWAAACLLKPILWVTVPVFLLAFALDARRTRSVAGTLQVLGVFAAALCLQGLGNFALFGSLLETGYGPETLRFTTPLAEGLFGLLLSPGRSLFLYAPVAAVGFLGLSRVPRPAKILCAGTPLLHLLVVARWWSWEGGAAWGPRHLLPVLPLLVAPAALVAAGAVRVAFLTGSLVNLPGVLVPPGAWDDYAEHLRPPTEASWSEAGPVRVSMIPSLSPVLGHAWLAARNVAGLDLPKPWLKRGVMEGQPPPEAPASVSPWLLRRAMSLPPVSPMIPRLLVHSAEGYLARGDAAKAVPWAREATRLSPADPEAARLLAYTEAQVRGPANR